MENVPSRDLSGEENERLAEQALKARLNNSSLKVREEYSAAVLGEQLRDTGKRHGRPASVSLETREHILDLASSGKSSEEIKKALKMERDWEAATSKKGRPPIGGAIDD